MGDDRRWPAWDDPALLVASDSRRVARYRRHQSWYREHVLGVGPGERPGRRGELVGNTLDPVAVRANPKLNFVNDAAHANAMRRAEEVPAEGGTLEAGRLFHNLMSSMTMCFNLFGAIGDEPGFIDLVRELFDPEAAEVEQVVCEVTPTDTLADRTAFDAMIHYRTGDGTGRFVGIETKYTEPFSPKAYDNDHYRSVTEASSWFVADAADSLVDSATNQLWRGLMLAPLTEAESGRHGCYVVVTPADDVAAENAVTATKAQLNDPGRLELVTVEQIVDAADGSGHAGLATWAEVFALRYLPEKGTS